jgi:hypothetical protein
VWREDVARHARETLRTWRAKREKAEDRRLASLQGEDLELLDGYAMLVQELTRLSRRRRFWQQKEG